MRGAIKRGQADHEQVVSGAWWTEYFNREGKRFGSFGKYLKKLRGKKDSAAELAATFKSMEKRGMNIRVRRIPRKD